MRKQLYLFIGGLGGALGLPVVLLVLAALLNVIERVHTFNGPTAIEAELHSVGFILPLLVPLLLLAGLVMGIVTATVMYEAGEKQRRT